MSLSKKHFEHLAEIVATQCMFGSSDNTYIREAIINFCQKNGHNFNEPYFKKRVTEIMNELNNETPEEI